MRFIVFLFAFGGCSALAATANFRHGQPAQAERAASAYVPDLTTIAPRAGNRVRAYVERYTTDRDALLRFYSVEKSDLQLRRLSEHAAVWRAALEKISYDSLDVEERIDWHLLRLHLDHAVADFERELELNQRAAVLLPFAQAMAGTLESIRLLQPFEGRAAASTLQTILDQTAELKKRLGSADAKWPSRVDTLLALKRLKTLRSALTEWRDYYSGYDPLFTWWTAATYEKLTGALDDYAKFLREKGLGVAKPEDDDPIVGDPLGRATLEREIAYELIPYSPEQLIKIAEQEFAFCETEWRKVAQQLGLGGDWKAALEKAKQDHLQPGQQPALIAEQAYEAIKYVESRDLITVPPLAIDLWRTAMMSPERQKTSPFFTGGECVTMSFPHASMELPLKNDSLRANNIHFCRATVHHELIPGHHLQQYYWERYSQHRQLFYTPFWVEGWALWWEFRLWDLGFQQTPLNSAGMLFWRTHRCARIMFTLNFHLGNWTPEQCVDFLVERVGHDRHTAMGEVRRSFGGDYPPLYQAGYMLGAIQLRDLYRELVTSGKLTEKQFHDRILEGGNMPIAFVRARLRGEALPKALAADWKFAGELK